MNGYENFILRMKASGGSLREEIKKEKARQEEADMDTDLSCCDTFYIWKGGKEPHDGEVFPLRITGRQWSAAGGHTIKVRTPAIRPAVCGATLHNKKDDTFWICTESDFSEGSGFLSRWTECNYCLKFRNQEAELLEYRCVCQNRTADGSMRQDGKAITLPSSRYLLTLPLEQAITALPYGKRFFLTYDLKNAPYVYQLAGKDMTGSKGLCRLTVVQCEKGESDDILTGVCDSIGPAGTAKPAESAHRDPNHAEPEPITASPPVKIRYHGSPAIRLGGAYKVFRAERSDSEGNTSGACGSWTIDCGFADRITAIPSEGQIKIKLADTYPELAGQTFGLLFTDASAATDRVTVTIESYT